MGDNIRMDLEEIGINAGNWVDSAQERDYWRAPVNAALNLPDSISQGVRRILIYLGWSPLKENVRPSSNTLDVILFILMARVLVRLENCRLF